MSGPNNSLESEKYLSDWNFDHLSANSFVDADVADVFFFGHRGQESVLTRGQDSKSIRRSDLMVSFYV